MKNINKWWIGGIAGLLVLLVLLILSSVQYGSLQDDFDDTEAENSSLTNQLSSVQSQLSQAQSDLTSLQSDYDNLQDSYDLVFDQLNSIQQLFPPKHFSSSEELQLWLNGNTVSNQPFALTYEEWYAKALQIQEDALRDGYIISVDIDYFQNDPDDLEDDSIGVWNVAIINGYMWFWDPETDEIIQDTSIGPILF